MVGLFGQALLSLGTDGFSEVDELARGRAQHRKQGKRVILMKPRLDTRFGDTKIASRSGLEAEADVIVDDDTALDPRRMRGVDCVLIDEAQFLSPRVIQDLRWITSVS